MIHLSFIWRQTSCLQSSLSVLAPCGGSLKESDLNGISHYFTTETTAQVCHYEFATLLNANIVFEDLGKVLAGIQVPPNDAQEFERFLQNLGYPYVEETENQVYKMYLQC